MEPAQHTLLSASCLGSPQASLQALDQALFQSNPPTNPITHPPTLHLPAPTEHSWSSVSAASPEMNTNCTPATVNALNSAGPPQFRCTEPDCGRVFKRKTSLTNHLKAHRNPNSRSLQRSKRQREALRARAKAEAAGTTPAPASASHPQLAPTRNPCLAGIEAMGMLAATPASAQLPPPTHPYTPIDLKPAPIIKKPKRYMPGSPRLNPLLSPAEMVKPQEAPPLLHPLPLQLAIGNGAAASTSTAQPATTVAASAPMSTPLNPLSTFTLPPTHQTLHHHLQYANHRMHQPQPSANDRLQTILPHSLPIPALSLHATSPFGLATSPVSATGGTANGGSSNLPTHPTFASTANYDGVITTTKYENANPTTTLKYDSVNLSTPSNGFSYSPAVQRTPLNSNSQFLDQPFEVPVAGSEAAIMGVPPCFTEDGGLLAPLDLNFLEDTAPTGAAVGRGTMEPPATSDHLNSY